MPTTTERSPLAWAKEMALKVIQSPARTAHGYPSVAETRDVKFHVVEERETANRRVLRLEGLVFHSALVVIEIKHERRGDAIVVEIKLAPAMGGRSGRFSTEIPLMDDTRKVLFGRDQVLIWSKDGMG